MSGFTQKKISQDAQLLLTYRSGSSAKPLGLVTVNIRCYGWFPRQATLAGQKGFDKRLLHMPREKENNSVRHHASSHCTRKQPRVDMLIMQTVTTPTKVTAVLCYVMLCMFCCVRKTSYTTLCTQLTHQFITCQCTGNMGCKDCVTKIA